jgi:GNAT superfamily N-acetyltransferase
MTARSRLSIRQILDPSDPAIARGHDLLCRTFPKDELVSRRDWRNALREQRAHLPTDITWHLVVAEKNGSVIGVATGNYLGNVNIGFVGYLAVSPAARGLGVGPRLRGRLRSLFRRDAVWIRGEPLQAVMGEVRRDNPWLRHLIRSDRILALDFAYQQPRLHRGGHPVPLVLYYEAQSEAPRRLPAVLVRQILYTSWRRIYRIDRPLANPVFRRMLRGLEKKRFVGALGPHDLPLLSARADRDA